MSTMYGSSTIMKMKVIAMTTVLVSTLGILTTLHTQFAFADPLIGSPVTTDFNIQSNGDSSGYIVCDPNCHKATNSNSNSNTNSNSSDSEAQPAYGLTVNVPSHPFGISTVGISITTENGHTDQADVPTAGGSSHTFNIPKIRENGYKFVLIQDSFPQTTVIHMKLQVTICLYHYLPYHHILSNTIQTCLILIRLNFKR
jgi:hypothetical protein